MRQPNGCSTPAPMSRRASSGQKNSLKRKKTLLCHHVLPPKIASFSIDVARETKGAMPSPKFLAYLVILWFARRRPKQKTVAGLKSKDLTPQKQFGLAKPLPQIEWKRKLPFPLRWKLQFWAKAYRKKLKRKDVFDER